MLLEYLFKKLKNSQKIKKYPRLVKAMETIEKLYYFADLINFLLFIKGSLYPTIVHRILEIRFVKKIIFLIFNFIEAY